MGRIMCIMTGILLGMLMTQGIAQAELVTFQYTGTIDSIQNAAITDGSVVIGTPFSGTYTFNSATPDSDPSPIYGVYDSTLTFGTAKVGNYNFVLDPSPPNTIHTQNDYQPGLLNQDSYTVTGSFGPSALIKVGVWSVHLSAAGPTTQYLLTSDSLPVVPPDLSLVNSQHTLLLSATPADAPGLEYFTIIGDLDSLTATAVPEPATLLLLGSGLIGLAGYGRKKFLKK